MASIFDETILKKVAKARGPSRKDAPITKAELMRIDPNMMIGGFKLKDIGASVIKNGRQRTYKEWNDKLY